MPQAHRDRPAAVTPPAVRHEPAERKRKSGPALRAFFRIADAWAGLRPATPNNVPLVGRTRLRNLYLDTGHGTLGWTLACGSARALADIVSGRRPDVAFDFLA